MAKGATAVSKRPRVSTTRPERASGVVCKAKAPRAIHSLSKPARLLICPRTKAGRRLIGAPMRRASVARAVGVLRGVARTAARGITLPTAQPHGRGARASTPNGQPKQAHGLGCVGRLLSAFIATKALIHTPKVRAGLAFQAARPSCRVRYVPARAQAAL